MAILLKLPIGFLVTCFFLLLSLFICIVLLIGTIIETALILLVLYLWGFFIEHEQNVRGYYCYPCFIRLFMESTFLQDMKALLRNTWKWVVTT